MRRPGKCDLTIYRGDTTAWQFRLWSDADRTVPFQIGEAAVKAEIRPHHNGPVNVELDCVVTEPNIIDVTIDSAAAASARSGVWDLQLTYPDTPPAVRTVVYGQVTVSADVTDAVAVAS